VTNGGFVFFGGFVAAVAAVIVMARVKGKRLRDLGDLVAPCLGGAHAVGRIGCFLHGCCYGGPTTAWWGITFPVLGDGLARHPTQLMEAAFLALLTAIAWLALGFREAGPEREESARRGGAGASLDRPGHGRLLGLIQAPSAPSLNESGVEGSEATPSRLRGPRIRAGMVWGGYVTAYAAFRFAIEFLRDDARGGTFTPAGLSVSQVIALAALVAGILWMVCCARAAPSGPGPEMPGGPA